MFGEALAGLGNRLGRPKEAAAGEMADAERLDAPAPAPAAEPDAATGGDTAGAEQIASANELALAVQASVVRRLVVLSVNADRDQYGSVELARRMASAGLATVLIDLTPEDRIASKLGIDGDCDGYAELAAGLATLADAIHRDHYTRLHVVPSHGYELGEANGADIVQLKTFLGAFAEAYDYTVLEVALLDIERLPEILDEETALVVAGHPQLDDLSADLAAALRALGLTDIIYMPSARRGRPEAAAR
ncbi:hypothetical protein [Jiella sp. M17.18]|uniref:hypothetical protein n=1 Tax=Jiella sp. M17.18 TaxID=3234247 RepID=UPI0034DF381A